MPLTPRGAPYPGDAPGVPNDVPGDLRKLAEWSDAHPGCTPMSSSSRSALNGAALWEGRLVYETDTNRLLVRVDGDWRRVAVDGTLGGEWQTTAMTLSGGAVVVNPPVERMIRWRRVGNTVTIRGSWAPINAPAGPLYLSLPTGADDAVPIPSLAGFAMVAGSVLPVTLDANRLRINIPTAGNIGLAFMVEYEVAS